MVQLRKGEVMRGIPLTPFGVALVDDEDYERLLGYGRWHRARRGKHIYAVCTSSKKKGRERQYMHRVVMRAAPGQRIDHRDQDGLNNQRANLREASHAENLRNRGLQANNTTGFTGVQFHRQSGLWHARIKVAGRNISLRYHKTAEDAARAYNAAAILHHGEFACLNIIPEEI